MNFDYLHFGGLFLEFGLHHHPSKSNSSSFLLMRRWETTATQRQCTLCGKCMSVCHTGVASVWMPCSFIKFYQVGSFLSVISSLTGGTDHQLLGTTYKKGKDSAARFRYIH